MMSVARKSKRSPRLTREHWLRAALDVLSREGAGRLRVAGISRALDVTKGSFYWHFEDRRDFLHAILEYWDKEFTRRVRDTAERRGGSAVERLKLVMQLVMDEDLSGYDAAFDAWANHEPGIAPQVQKVYRFRYKYIRCLFVEAGFDRAEAHVRTIAFLGFLKYRFAAAGAAKGRKVGKEEIDRAFALLTAL